MARLGCSLKGQDNDCCVLRSENLWVSRVMRVCTLTSRFWARHRLVSANTFSDGALTPETANSFSSWASLDVPDIEQLEYSSLHLPTDFNTVLKLNHTAS